MKRVTADFARVSLVAGNNFCEIAHVKAEGREENLCLAIGAYETGLAFFTQQRFPRQWARAKGSLGTAYGMLSEVRDKEENLGKAIGAYGEVSKVYTLTGFPVDYAMTRSSLGNAYARLSEVRDKEENLGKAIVAYGEAL